MTKQINVDAISNFLGFVEIFSFFSTVKILDMVQKHTEHRTHREMYVTLHNAARAAGLWPAMSWMCNFIFNSKKIAAVEQRARQAPLRHTFTTFPHTLSEPRATQADSRVTLDDQADSTFNGHSREKAGSVECCNTGRKEVMQTSAFWSSFLCSLLQYQQIEPVSTLTLSNSFFPESQQK